MPYLCRMSSLTLLKSKCSSGAVTIIPQRTRYYWEARPECRERQRLMMITLPRLKQKKETNFKKKIIEPKLYGLDVILHQEVQEIFNSNRMVCACLHAKQHENDYYRVRYELKQNEMSMERYEKHVLNFTLKNTRYENLLTLFDGPCVLIFGEPNAAQMISAVKKNKNLLLLGGTIDDKLMSFPEIVKFAELKSLDHSRGQLCGILSTLSSSTYNLLKKPAASLSTSLKQYIKDNDNESNNTREEK